MLLFFYFFLCKNLTILQKKNFFIFLLSKSHITWLYHTGAPLGCYFDIMKSHKSYRHWTKQPKDMTHCHGSSVVTMNHHRILTAILLQLKKTKTSMWHFLCVHRATKHLLHSTQTRSLVHIVYTAAIELYGSWINMHGVNFGSRFFLPVWPVVLG